MQIKILSYSFLLYSNYAFINHASKYNIQTASMYITIEKVTWTSF